VNAVYLMPGVGKREGEMGVDMFPGEEAVVEHIRTNVPFLAEKIMDRGAGEQNTPPPSSRLEVIM